MNSKAELLSKSFSHIYVEKEAFEYKLTGDILNRFSSSNVISIDHYKDVFNRSRQSFSRQKDSRALILAVRHGNKIFKGAPVCQDFGNDNFHYSSSIMNCPFNCEYCYLKGMYPTANIVVFVNIEDYFEETSELLKEKGKVYICVSYDSDLVVMDSITEISGLWGEYAKANPDVTIEIRTKGIPQNMVVAPNVIYAYTVSPDEVCRRFEHGAPGVKARLNSAFSAMEKGVPVRLCFDPMIYIPDYEKHYSELVNMASKVLSHKMLKDVSIGTFRISEDYLKNMRKMSPDSAIAWFPYEVVDGYAQYPEEIQNHMMEFMRGEVTKYVEEERIWLWK